MVGEGCDYIEWDSRLVLREEGSEIGFLDLLTVDRPLIVPINVLVRVFVTSEDVIHRWGAPGIGIKIDAIPGRLTRGLFELKLPGIIFGMCAELCGAMHSMMPTIVEGVPLAVYESWLGYLAGSRDLGLWTQALRGLGHATEEFKRSLGPKLFIDLAKAGYGSK